MAPLVDVVVPNWNGEALLGPCLDSLARQTLRDHRVVVVDDGSTDGSRALLAGRYPEALVVAHAKNRGFPAAVNSGMRAGDAPYVCWLNNDTVAEPGFLEHLVRALETHGPEGVGMAAPRVLFQDSPGVVNSAGLFVGPDGIARDRGFGLPDGPAFDAPREVFGPAGVAALYARALVRAVGPLDEDFFLYSEEVDFDYRAQLLGWRCRYVPEARVYHRGSATTAGKSALAARLASRNGLLAVLKNLPGPLLARMLPAIAAGQLYQLGVFAARGQLGPALRGKAEALGLLGPTLAKRAAIQRARRLSGGELAARLRLGRMPPRLLRPILGHDGR